MMSKLTKIKEIRMAFVYEMMETIKGITSKEIADRLGISDKTVYKYKKEFVDRQNIGQPAVKYDITGYKVPTTEEEALVIYNEIEELEQVIQKSEEEMDKFFAEEQQKEAEKVESKVEERPTAKEEPKVEERPKPQVAHTVKLKPKSKHKTKHKSKHKTKHKSKHKTKHKTKPIHIGYTSPKSSSSTKKQDLFNGLVKVAKVIFKKGK